MGLNKEQYAAAQSRNLKQMMDKQDGAIKSTLDDNLTMRTTWQKDKPISFQKRPQTDKSDDNIDEPVAEEKPSWGYATDYIESSGSMRRVSQGRMFEKESEQQEYQKQAELYRQQQLEKLKEQKKEKQSIKQFLKKDDWMFFSKFIIIHDYDDYMHKIRDKISISEITGVYLIANATKHKMYVGYGSRAIEKCGQHFRARYGANDKTPEIRNDLLIEDVMCVNFVKLKDTDFDSLQDLAKHYIDKYNCYSPRGYNIKS